jgi:hypothetical protein
LRAVVSGEEEVTVKNEGFEHRKVSIDFKKSTMIQLKQRIQYSKLQLTMFGEYAENYSNVDFMDSPTTMTCKFQLGNMSGVSNGNR